MKNRIVRISDKETVTVPNEIRMSICEIAELFGIYYQTAKRHIRVIEKSGIADGDYSMYCTVEGQKVVPEYYGLEMIIAVAFRVQSRNAEVFRMWLLKKVSKVDIPEILIMNIQNPILN